MTNQEAVGLITGGISRHDKPQNWADLGCGSGTFTEALATLLPVGSHILAVDKSLQRFPKTWGNNVKIDFVQADFERSDLNVSALDGILLANSLHYIADKTTLIHKLEMHLNAEKRFLIVEYDTLSANQWVPYPIDFSSLEKLFLGLHYREVAKLSQRKSAYGPEMMYSASIFG